MSKRLGNIVNPWDAIAKHGVDPVRWYLVASAAPWLTTACLTAAIDGFSPSVASHHSDSLSAEAESHGTNDSVWFAIADRKSPSIACGVPA